MFDETEKQIIEEGMEVKSRFMVSLLTNVLRGFLSFITILILARGLGPASYGDFAFLMGSFVAIKTLLDLGTSSAFYTFLSQKPRGSYFILIYIIWNPEAFAKGRYKTLMKFQGLIKFLLRENYPSERQSHHKKLDPNPEPVSKW